MSLEALCSYGHKGQWVSDIPIMVDNVSPWALNILIQRAVTAPNTMEFAIAFAIFAVGFILHRFSLGLTSKDTG